MDSFDEFYNIGLGFAKASDVSEDSSLPSNTLITLANDIENAKKKVKELDGYTKDGRPRNVFSIVVKPDKDYVNPDPTGNGVSTESLNAYYDTTESGAKAKSKLNNLSNILMLGRRILNKTVTSLGISPNKLCAIHIIYNNMIFYQLL